MTIEILTDPNNDPEFIDLVGHVVSGLTKDRSPEEVFVMKIDNWFDHKWLTFSGIGSVRFDDFRLDIDTALDQFWQKKVTFPPFTPNRVIGEYYFVRGENGEYLPSVSRPFIHERKLAHSSENLHKRVADFADSAIFVWVSSNSKSNRRGSLMVYDVKGSDVQTWYVGLSKEDNWRVLQTKGLAHEQIQSLLPHDISQERT